MRHRRAWRGAASASSSASRSAWPRECAAQIGFAFGLYIFMSAIFEQTLLSKEQRETKRARGVIMRGSGKSETWCGVVCIVIFRPQNYLLPDRREEEAEERGRGVKIERR